STPDDETLPPPADWLATERDLANLMAHDVRNPLAALMANVNFLETVVPTEDADAHEALGDMRRSLEQVLRLSDNRVAIARLEARASDPSTVPFVIGKAVHAALERVKPMLSDAGVRFTLTDLSEGAIVRGDAALCELMIENLAGNSAQHAGRGRAARLEVTANETEVTVVLEDEGTPFGPADRDFTREGQVAMKTRSDARYSRGLALYVVGLVTRSMSGSVETASPDAHARVTLRFPRA
ncbi:MAG: HAMP domain-containing sensor histidine kinase, partial [Deltaproteobacteria bacterium]